MLLGAVFRVMHPELYLRSREALLSLGQNPEFDEILQHWGTAFNAISVISNRITPEHRDTQSRKEWFDLLVAIGNYSAATLRLPGLGIELVYHSGTLVFFSGKLLQHAVDGWDGTDRVCLAYYMRDLVQERAGIPAAGWMKQEQLLGPETFAARAVENIWGKTYDF